MKQNTSRVVASDSNTSRNGLVCHYQFENGSSQFIFLHISNKNGSVHIDQSLGFATENYVQVISSCKGLFLLVSIGEKDLKFHVFNPISKQFFTLPQLVITREIIRSGLAFHGDHYQVILVYGNTLELEMEIFSSETGKWSTHNPLNNLFLPSLPEFEFSELKTPPLFSNGAIHWEISGNLLVYNLENDHSELIELPNLPNFLDDWSWQATMPYKSCLWESQGRVHYTYTDFDGIQTWVLLNDHDHDHYSYFNIYDRKKFRWALVHSINHQELRNLKHQENFFFHDRWDWQPYDVSALAFCEDSETMYLQIPGFVVSYNTKTKVVEEACRYKFAGVDFNCCSFLPFIYGSKFHQETASDQLEEVEAIDLPIKDQLDTFSF